jgi:hypothetical protein
MDHFFTTVSGSITDTSHFFAVIIMGLGGIQPDPEEEGCINRRDEIISIFFLFCIVVQLDPFCCEPIFPIKLLLEGVTIECGTCNGFMNDC